MRQYNESALEGEDLRFYGFDMQRISYSTVGALITMLGTFYSGYKGSKSSHKYFAASSLLCMIMAIYTGHRIISKNKKTEKESNSIENEE